MDWRIQECAQLVCDVFRGTPAAFAVWKSACSPIFAVREGAQRIPGRPK